MSRPLLQVKNLSLSFGTPIPSTGRRKLLDALTDINFELHAGETLALLGESGCGKSLTALALMRLLPGQAIFQQGQVLLANDDPSSRSEDLMRVSEDRMREVRGRRMAMIFQEPATSLNPIMRIGQQIAEVLRLHHAKPVAAIDQEVRALLAQVGLPDPERAARAYPFELSGGMKQRAMIAMALAGNPDILLADEPTTALDVTLQAQILDLLQSLQQQRQMGMLLITHDLAVVAARADRVAVMYAGQIVEAGNVKDVLTNPAHPYTRALLAALPERARPGQPLIQLAGRVPPLGDWPLACRFAPRCALAEPHCDAEAPPWVTLPASETETTAVVRHFSRCWRVDTLILEARTDVPERDDNPDTSSHVGQPVLEVRDLIVRYTPAGSAWWQGIRQWMSPHSLVAARPVVDGLSLTLNAGETLALVGESGCGKTTTAKAVLRLIDTESGLIRLAGTDIVGPGVRPARGWRRDVQMVFQDPFASLDPRQRISQVLAEGPRALGLPASEYDRAALLRLLDRVGLPSQALDRFPHEFSGGQRQRIAIARALAVSPKVLICDEPTSALDVSVQAQILNLLKQLQRDTGMAYLFITHNFGVVRYLADRVMVMQQGKVVESGPTQTLLNDPRHAYTQSLMASVPRIIETQWRSA